MISQEHTLILPGPGIPAAPDPGWPAEQKEALIKWLHKFPLEKLNKIHYM